MAIPLLAFPLDPTLAPSQYVRDHWGRAEGLPDNSVWAITQTRDGYLWLGTERGLVRFDGERFVLYGPSTNPPLETGVVTCLRETRDGTLMIGTRGGAFEYRGGKFRRLEIPGTTADRIVHDLFEDDKGRRWVASDGALGYFEKGTYRRFSVPGGEDLVGMLRVRTASDGALWFLEGRKAYRFADGRLASRDLPGVSQVLEADSAGHLWAVTPGHLIPLGGGEARAEELPPFRDGMVLGLLGDRDAALWIGGMEGLFLRRGGRLDPFELAAGRKNSVTSLFEDREGSVWVATPSDGLWRLRNPLIASFGKPEGLDLGYVDPILESKDGALWIGTQANGLVRWRDGVVTRYDERDGIPAREIASLFEDGGGGLWVGTPNGLALFDGRNGFRSVQITSKHPCVVFSLAQLGGGSLVASTNAGLLVRRNGRWDELEPSTGQGFATGIVPDGERGAWLSTLGRGVLYWNGERMKAYGEAEGLPAADVASLHRDSRGKLWAGTVERGLGVLQGTRFRMLGPAEGLPEGPIYRILEASECLWLSGKDGITRLRLDDLDRWLAGAQERVTATLYGQADGMRSAECNGGFQPAGWKTRDGILWFPTTDGIVRVSPGALATRDSVKQVLVEETLVDGAFAPLSEGPLRLRPGTGRIEVHYTAPCFASTGRVQFEVRLEGFDADWIEAGTRRVAYYTNLPPRSYRFRVRACGEDGAWVESHTALAIIKEPSFWQTWSFRLMVLAALAGLLHLVYRMRVRTVRRRFEAIVEERNRISREIHDSLTQSFTGVVLNLEAAERSWDAGGGSSLERVQRAKSVAREGLVEARRFVRGLRPLVLESGDLPSAVEKVAKDTAAGSGAEVSFRFAGRRRRLPPGVEDGLFRIVQEAVGNGARHAGAKRIGVELALTRTEAALTIEDDGCGFDPEAVTPSETGGYGLRGIRERAEAMKGTFTLETAKGEGTRIQVRVPTR